MMPLYYWALSSGIKVVLFFITISALLGFTLMSTAEGAVSWNGFLKEVGFNPPTVYEISHTVVIPEGEGFSPTFSLICEDGDWYYHTLFSTPVSVDPSISDSSISVFFSGSFVTFDEPSNDNTNGRLIGREGDNRMSPINTLAPTDLTTTTTLLCFSPSSLMTVGGEWQATDTTALIIGYSVLNAYWIAPVGIGIGLGIYLVKKKIE